MTRLALSWLMWEVPAPCGWCYPWAGGADLDEKGDKASYGE